MCAKGYDEALGHELYDLIVRFADYGFNRAHAAAYAVLAYQTAYLKAHYPSRSWRRSSRQSWAVSTNWPSTLRLPPAVVKYCLQTSTTGVAGFSVEGDAIRFGLSAIKNVGVHAIESIVRNRKHKGYYRDLFHFCASVDPRACNKRLIESLILSGATATLPGHRAQQLRRYWTRRWSTACASGANGTTTS